MGKHISVHDHFFRSVMADSRVAKEFFGNHLPEHIQKQIDWNYFEPQNETFIDDADLSHQAIDILYKTKFSGEEGYIYALVEHQSKPLKDMPFRILKYLIAILDYHIKQHGGTKLPAVYPIIFYAGHKPYNYSTDLFPLFEENESFMREVLFSPYQLVDVNKIDDEELKKRVWSGVFMYTMKHIFQKDFLPYLENMIPELQIIEKKDGIDYICTIFSYICGRGEIRDKEAFEKIVKKGLPAEVGEKVMTLADIYRREGENKGRMEGEARGREETLHEVIMKMSDNGLSVEDINQITNLPADEIVKIIADSKRDRH